MVMYIHYLQRSDLFAFSSSSSSFFFLHYHNEEFVASIRLQKEGDIYRVYCGVGLFINNVTGIVFVCYAVYNM